MSNPLKELAKEIVDRLYGHEFISEDADFEKAKEHVYQVLVEHENAKENHGC